MTEQGDRKEQPEAGALSMEKKEAFTNEEEM